MLKPCISKISELEKTTCRMNMDKLDRCFFLYLISVGLHGKIKINRPQIKQLDKTVDASVSELSYYNEKLYNCYCKVSFKVLFLKETFLIFSPRRAFYDTRV